MIRTLTVKRNTRIQKRHALFYEALCFEPRPDLPTYLIWNPIIHTTDDVTRGIRINIFSRINGVRTRGTSYISCSTISWCNLLAVKSSDQRYNILLEKLDIDSRGKVMLSFDDWGVYILAYVRSYGKPDPDPLDPTETFEYKLVQMKFPPLSFRYDKFHLSDDRLWMPFRNPPRILRTLYRNELTRCNEDKIWMETTVPRTDGVEKSLNGLQHYWGLIFTVDNPEIFKNVEHAKRLIGKPSISLKMFPGNSPDAIQVAKDKLFSDLRAIRDYEVYWLIVSFMSTGHVSISWFHSDFARDFKNSDERYLADCAMNPAKVNNELMFHALSMTMAKSRYKFGFATTFRKCLQAAKWKLEYYVPIPKMPKTRYVIGSEPLEVEVDEDLIDERAPLSRKFYDTNSNTPFMSLFHIYISPSKIFVEGPYMEMGNRLLRRYPYRSFIRVSFCDEDRSDLYLHNSETLAAYISDFLEKGIKIGSQHFVFLGYGNSQLRNFSCWFVDNTMDSRKIIKELGDFSSMKPPKAAARQGQCFSATIPTIELTGNNWIQIPDVETPALNGKNFCFSDGVGLCSKSVMEDVSQLLRLNYVPSAVQFRFQGAKGMLSCHPAGFRPGAEIVIKFRPSQFKFISAPTDSYLEICEPANALSLTYNRQILLILDTLDADWNIILGDLEHDLKIIANAFKTPGETHTHTLAGQPAAHTRLRGWLVGCVQNNFPSEGNEQFLRNLTAHGVKVESLRNLVVSGFDALSDVMMLKLTRYLARWYYREQLLSFRFPVRGGIALFGIFDESRTLKYAQRKGELHEVYVAYLDFGTTPRYIKGNVLITRSPPVHPGDVQLCRAVGKRANLQHLVNVVVFPGPAVGSESISQRDLPNMLSGGDLDGDQFQIFFDEKLVKSVKPYEAGAAEWTVPGYKSPSEEMDALKPTTVRDFFVGYHLKNNLGVLGNAHISLAHSEEVYKQGKAAHPSCLKIAHLYQKTVDFSKTGETLLIKERFRPRSDPSFMHPLEYSIQQTYDCSYSLIGQIHCRIREFFGSARNEREYIDLPKPIDPRLEPTFGDSFMKISVQSRPHTFLPTRQSWVKIPHLYKTSVPVTWWLKLPGLGRSPNLSYSAIGAFLTENPQHPTFVSENTARLERILSGIKAPRTHIKPVSELAGRHKLSFLAIMKKFNREWTLHRDLLHPEFPNHMNQAMKIVDYYSEEAYRICASLDIKPSVAEESMITALTFHDARSRRGEREDRLKRHSSAMLPSQVSLALASACYVVAQLGMLCTYPYSPFLYYEVPNSKNEKILAQDLAKHVVTGKLGGQLMTSAPFSLFGSQMCAMRCEYRLWREKSIRVLVLCETLKVTRLCARSIRKLKEKDHEKEVRDIQTKITRLCRARLFEAEIINPIQLNQSHPSFDNLREAYTIRAFAKPRFAIGKLQEIIAAKPRAASGRI